MELRNLYYFLQVCEDKNYTVAASKLYITQQALSKSIKALEQELGTALFAKSPSGICLTPYGEAIYPICKDMVRHFEAGMHKIQSVSKDGAMPIRLAISYQSADTLSFTLVDDFQQMHPNIHIQYDALPDLMAEDAILSGNADFLLSIGIPRKEKMFHYDLIRPLPLCIMVGPNHPLYGEKSLRIQDMEGIDLHCAGPQFKTYHLLRAKAREAGCHLKLIPTSGHLYATYRNIFEANRAVIGIYGSDEEPEFSGIRQIPFEDPELNWDIYFCYLKDHVFTEAEKLFYQYILSFAVPENKKN